jgi:O-antigen/teichoic acid export membrane protein
VFSLLFVFLIRRDVLSLLIGTTVSYALLTAPMAFQLGLTRPGARLSQAIDAAFARRVTRYGLPLVGSMVAGSVLELSHRFIINLYKGPEQVGIFTANYNVAILVVGFIAGPILFAAEPMIVNTWESRDRSKVQGIISTLSRYLMLLALPIGCFIAVYAELIASVAFGQAFREGFPVISFVVFGMILFQFGMYGHKILKLVEQTRVLFGLLAVCAIANIALNFALVPAYGYWGAAIASLVSYGLYPVMVYFVAKRYLPWLIPWRSLARIGVASLVATGVWWVTRPAAISGLTDWVQIGGSGMAGAIAYVAALVVLGEVRAYEKSAVRAGMVMLRGKLVHRTSMAPR